MNTIASRDQFKPITMGENLVANYEVILDEAEGRINYLEIESE